MLNYLTTSDIAKAAKKTRQQIWNLWMDRKLPAELLNPGGSRLRFKKTRDIEEWCLREAKKADDRVRKRRSRQYRFWSQYHQTLLARLVTEKKPNLHCDLIAFRAWKDLTVKHRLTLDELNRSFKRGIVTRIKNERGDGRVGISTWQGLMLEFGLLRKQIGGTWKDWLPEEKAMICDRIVPIIEFFLQLRDKRNDSP
jgi:hypothetical protein